MTLEVRSKSANIFIFLSALLTGCSSSVVRTGNDAASYTPDGLKGLSIIYSANTNGEIAPCGCRSNPLGGLSRRYNWQTKALPTEDKEPLIIDSGDLFYASASAPEFLLPQWNTQAEALVDAYNLLKVDVFTPGDQDFAGGLERFLKLQNQAKFKFVANNIYLKKTGKPLLKPFEVLTKNGKKIAVIGVYNNTFALPDELEARDPITETKQAVRELRGKADGIVVLSHLGFEKDKELAESVSHIDAIFGGHSQNYLTEPVRIADTLLFQVSLRGQHIGLYSRGNTNLVPMDQTQDSVLDRVSAMDKIVIKAKDKIQEINTKLESELQSTTDIPKAAEPKKQDYRFATLPQCVACHAKQFDFYRQTRHGGSFQTLVHKKQSANFECLKCHTLGLQEPGGYHKLAELVQTKSGKKETSAQGSAAIKTLSADALAAKYSKLFINVQCEHCHGTNPEHPQGSTSFQKISGETCLKCHTLERAPAWYDHDKKPNTALIAKKLKQISCPK